MYLEFDFERDRKEYKRKKRSTDTENRTQAFGQAILVQVFWSIVSQNMAALVPDCTSIEEQFLH